MVCRIAQSYIIQTTSHEWVLNVIWITSHAPNNQTYSCFSLGRETTCLFSIVCVFPNHFWFVELYLKFGARHVKNRQFYAGSVSLIVKFSASDNAFLEFWLVHSSIYYMAKMLHQVPPSTRRWMFPLLSDACNNQCFTNCFILKS